VIAYMVLIFIASSIPDVKTLPGGVSDKTVHFWVYGFLALLLFRALAHGQVVGLTISRAFLTVLFSMLYGVSDEFHQAFVPGRTPDIHDVMADTLGAAGVALLILLVTYRRRSRTLAAQASRPPA
jgi:VanZ family protein